MELSKHVQDPNVRRSNFTVAHIGFRTSYVR